jgi:Pyridine nucleotide-disulphide oxidoreductase/NDH2 C-terminal domain
VHFRGEPTERSPVKTSQSDEPRQPGRVPTFVENPHVRPGQKQVIVIGDGFAGLNAAKTLAGHDEVHVTIIDQRNHHLFQPLLYQVATAGLSPADIAVSIRSIFRSWRNVAVHLARVTTINVTEKWIATEVRLRRRRRGSGRGADCRANGALGGRCAGGEPGQEPWRGTRSRRQGPRAARPVDSRRPGRLRRGRHRASRAARRGASAGPRPRHDSSRPCGRAKHPGGSAQQPRTAFQYRDKGVMATIGKHRAIARTGTLNLTGFVAWLAWLFVHLLYLIGFKNRVFVLAQWAWSYLFSKRGARLITEREWRLDA